MMNDALQKVKVPAVGLIITGVGNGVIGLLTVVSGLLRLAGLINTSPQGVMNEAERAGYYFGTGLSYVIGTLSLLFAPVIIFGAIKMMNGQKPGLAKTAAILALIPGFTCCFFLGAIFGIWALVVMSKPDVKAVFQSGSSGQSNFPPPPQF